MNGRVFADIEGLSVTAADREFLAHPLIAGITLFARNYESPGQLLSLTNELKAIARPDPLLIAVDQEGGRVQRFLRGFTRLPSASQIGEAYACDEAAGLEIAHAVGRVLAFELREVGVDFSFAPCLDITTQPSAVIGERAYGFDALTVTTLAREVIRAFKVQGMTCVGKHFPGHGGVSADSHFETPRDSRTLSAIQALDVEPYRALSAELEGVMSAHVVFDEVEPSAATFSSFWLQDVLRRQLQFDGVVFSDDLSMNGAAIGGTVPERVERALRAGCDIGLVCNDRASAEATVSHLALIRNDLPRRQRSSALRSLSPRRSEARPEQCHFDAVASVSS